MPDAEPIANIEKIRLTIEKVLSDEKIFRHSAKVSFKQFDTDEDGLLRFPDVEAFFERLRTNLTIPPIPSPTMKIIFEKYDSKNRNALSSSDFIRMYKALLLKIRNKYFPPRLEQIRSTFFIPVSPLQKTEELHKIIRFEKKLGSGAFGEVHLVTDMRINALRALKTINKSRVQVPFEQVQEEIEILKSVDHPNVIRIFQVFEDNNSVYILQELCRGGEILSTLIIDSGKAKLHTESYVRRIMKEIFSGLCHIHSKRIVHKDLKPENILFVDKSPESPVKIIDFGLGEIFRGQAAVTDVLRGSAIYMAPEAFTQGQLYLKSDVWSAACIMYNLFTGKFPFDAEDLPSFRHVITTKNLNLEKECPNASPAARNLMDALFQKSPELRLSASQALQHEWFSDPEDKLPTFNLSQSICLNLRDYAKRSGLRNAFLNMMAQQLSIDHQKVRRIAEIFKEMDTDNRGTLSTSDLLRALTEAGFKEWDANLVIQQLDLKGEGAISYREFLAACFCWRESEMNLIWAAFQRLDTENRNRVRRDDLLKLLLGESSLMKESDRKTIDEMIDSLDLEKDGWISWTDFEKFVLCGSSNDFGSEFFLSSGPSLINTSGIF